MDIEHHVWDKEQAQEATAKEIEEYIQKNLDDYVEIGLSGTELYREWKADFINFTAPTFSKNCESARNLRDFLRKNGVYIRKSRRTIAIELANALNNPEPWPEEDQDRPAWMMHYNARTNFTSNGFQKSSYSLAITTNKVPVEASHSEESPEQDKQYAESLAITTDKVPVEAADSEESPEQDKKSADSIDFTSNESQQYAESLLATTTNEAPVEAAHSINIIEEYHKPLMIMDEFKENAINNTAGPDGITPTLLVFSTFPRMSEPSQPAPSIAQPATAIKKEMAEITKLQATRQVNNALQICHRLRIENLYMLPVGPDAVAWRIHHKK
jgi:hypothetical protein